MYFCKVLIISVHYFCLQGVVSMKTCSSDVRREPHPPAAESVFLFSSPRFPPFLSPRYVLASVYFRGGDC